MGHYDDTEERNQERSLKEKKEKEKEQEIIEKYKKEIKQEIIKEYENDVSRYRDLTKEAIDDIKKELKFARGKFPGNRHMMVALTEEVGELAQALIDNYMELKSNHEVYMKAIQVASMAIRVATEGDNDFNYDPEKL